MDGLPFKFFPTACPWPNKVSYGSEGVIDLQSPVTDKVQLLSRGYKSGGYKACHAAVPLSLPNPGYLAFPPDEEGAEKVSRDMAFRGAPYAKFQAYQFTIHHPDAYIPSDMLAESVTEELSWLEQQKAESLRSRGAMAFLPQLTDAKTQGWLLYGSGKNMDELTCSRLCLKSSCDSEMVDDGCQASCGVYLKCDSAYKLSNHIYQVVVASPSWSPEAFAGVLTDYQCVFFTLSLQDSGPGMLQPCSALRCSTEPCAVDVSPHIVGEAVIVTETASVSIWTASAGLHTLRPAVWQSGDSRCQQWQSCLFSSHPRQVLLASTEAVQLFDIRTKSAEDLTLLSQPTLPTSEHLSAFQRHPTNSFHTMAASRHSLFLLDQRFPGHPVLTWDHFFVRAPHLLDVTSVSRRQERQDHVAMLSSCADRSSVCYEYIDGLAAKCLPKCLAPGGLGERACSAPVASVPPYQVGNYSEWFGKVSSTNHSYCVIQRLQTPLCGSAVAAHDRQTGSGYWAFQLSGAGEVFVQNFTKSHESDGDNDVDNSSGASASQRMGISCTERAKRWLQVVQDQLTDCPWESWVRQPAGSLDFSVIHRYVVSKHDQPLCLRCFRQQFDSCSPIGDSPGEERGSPPSSSSRRNENSSGPTHREQCFLDRQGCASSPISSSSASEVTQSTPCSMCSKTVGVTIRPGHRGKYSSFLRKEDRKAPVRVPECKGDIPGSESWMPMTRPGQEESKLARQLWREWFSEDEEDEENAQPAAKRSSQPASSREHGSPSTPHGKRRKTGGLSSGRKMGF